MEASDRLTRLLNGMDRVRLGEVRLFELAGDEDEDEDEGELPAECGPRRSKPANDGSLRNHPGFPIVEAYSDTLCWS